MNSKPSPTLIAAEIVRRLPELARDSSINAEQTIRGLIEERYHTQHWIDRVDECARYGRMLGALQGLRYAVDDRLKKAIDEILKECEPKKD